MIKILMTLLSFLILWKAIGIVDNLAIPKTNPIEQKKQELRKAYKKGYYDGRYAAYLALHKGIKTRDAFEKYITEKKWIELWREDSIFFEEQVISKIK